MKKELEKELKPTFDTFISELLNIETTKQGEVKYAKGQSVKADALISSLEKQKVDNREALQKELVVLKGKQDALDDAYKALSDETSNQTILNSKVAASLKKIETNEKETQDIKTAIANELEKKIK